MVVVNLIVLTKHLLLCTLLKHNALRYKGQNIRQVRSNIESRRLTKLRFPLAWHVFVNERQFHSLSGLESI